MTAGKTLAAFSALVLTSGLGGCAARQGNDDEAEPKPPAEVTIEVENQNFNDARIYLLLYGERTRLGLVPGHTTRTFSFALPPDDVRIEVSFIGGGGFVTEPMPVSPGDELVLQIQPDAHRELPEADRGSEDPMLARGIAARARQRLPAQMARPSLICMPGA